MSIPFPTLTALWRYPVKSMQGESLTTSAVTERGILGDRAYALLDVETGFIVSAKHPRKWHKVLQCRATYQREPQFGAPLPPVLITLPDGREVISDDPTIDAILSAELGRAVRLIQSSATPLIRESNRTPIDATDEVIREEPIAIAAPMGTFFDHAPLHLLTTATLAQLSGFASGSQFDVRRFRPNLVVTPAETGFVENSWLGKNIGIRDVQLQLIDPCPRCVVTTLAQADLPHDPQILRMVSHHNSAASVTLVPGHVFKGVVGIYASIVKNGQLEVGAPLVFAD